MCKEWRYNYKAFRDWAMANGYDEDAPRGECTIDRIDVNGNYEPSNCRWVSMSVQAKNRRGGQMQKVFKQRKAQAEEIRTQMSVVANIAVELAMKVNALSEGQLPSVEHLCKNEYKIIDFAGRKVLIAVID